MKANKIMLNGETILDLTEDTVEEQDVSVGKTFHKADGTEAVGTATGNGVSSYNDLSNKPSIVLAVNEAGTLFVTTIHDYEKKQKAFVEYSIFVLVTAVVVYGYVSVGSYLAAGIEYGKYPSNGVIGNVFSVDIQKNYECGKYGQQNKGSQYTEPCFYFAVFLFLFFVVNFCHP
jgi:hypothetical protein